MHSALLKLHIFKNARISLLDAFCFCRAKNYIIENIVLLYAHKYRKDKQATYRIRTVETT